jgi:phosphohistidine phosphatase
MKHIYIVRHAKSSWAYTGLSDHDRPLNGRGKRDAPIMAGELKNRVDHIQVALSSTARRAKETFEYFSNVFHFDKEYLVARLYHAYTNVLIDEIAMLEDEYDSAILFAHNPGLTELYNHFSRRYLANLPTCGIFELIINADRWSDIDTSNTTVGFILQPKDQ